MTAAELLERIGGMEAEPKRRVQRAGAEGYVWVWENINTLLGQGFTPDAVEAMAKASAVAACEVQLIVEGFHPPSNV